MANWFSNLICVVELDEIKELNERVDLLKKQVETETQLEAFYNNKYPKTDIFYKGRQLPNIKRNIEIDVKNFFQLHDGKVKKVAEEIELGESHDETALNCLNWVIENIDYVLDKTKGNIEFWQYPFETLKYGSGDCEDGAILLANLMIMKGIPYWKVRLTAGNVNGGGHAYLVYYCESKEKWVIMDWCYWPNTLSVETRKNYKQEKNYYGVWFSWNKKYAYSQGLNTEAREMLK